MNEPSLNRMGPIVWKCKQTDNHLAEGTEKQHKIETHNNFILFYIKQNITDNCNKRINSNKRYGTSIQNMEYLA